MLDVSDGKFHDEDSVTRIDTLPVYPGLQMITGGPNRYCQVFAEDASSHHLCQHLIAILHEQSLDLVPDLALNFQRKANGVCSPGCSFLLSGYPA